MNPALKIVLKPAMGMPASKLKIVLKPAMGMPASKVIIY